MRVISKYKLDTSSIDESTGRFKVRASTNNKFPRTIKRSNGTEQTYLEVLSHRPEDIDLSYIEAGAGSLLLHHTDATKLGFIEEVEVRDNLCTIATVKFTDENIKRGMNLIKSNQYSHTSVGAKLNNIVRQYKDADGNMVVEFGWTMHEISLTPTPMDPNCHIVQRSNEDYDSPVEVSNTTIDIDSQEFDDLYGATASVLRSTVFNTMQTPQDKVVPATPSAETTTKDTHKEEVSSETKDVVVTTTKEIHTTEITTEVRKELCTDVESSSELSTEVKVEDAAQAEAADMTVQRSNYMLIAGVHKDLAEKALASNLSETELRALLVQRSVDSLAQQLPIKEKKMISLGKILSALSASKYNELSAEDKDLVKQNDSGFTVIPTSVVMRSFAAGTGVNTTGYTTQGGNLIPKDMSSDVIGHLYDLFQMSKAGVKMPALTRPMTFPVTDASGEATWLDENAPAVAQSVATRQKSVKPHYLRIVYDISVSAIREAHDNISVEAIFAQDWIAKIELALQKAILIGNPADVATPGSPTGVITELQSTPALSGQLVSLAGAYPTFAEMGAVFAKLEDAQASNIVVICNATTKWALCTTPLIAGQAVYLAKDTGLGQADLLGKQLFVVPSNVLANGQILVGDMSGIIAPSFHGGIEVINDEKVLASTNQVRFTVRAAYDVLTRRPNQFVFVTSAP